MADSWLKSHVTDYGEYDYLKGTEITERWTLLAWRHHRQLTDSLVSMILTTTVRDSNVSILLYMSSAYIRKYTTNSADYAPNSAN